MRRMIFIMAAALGCLTTQAQNRKISINVSKQPLSTVLQRIQQDCGYNMVYSDEVVSDTMLVSIEVSRIPVSELLDKLLPAKQLFYKMMSDKMIVVGSKQFQKQMDDPINVYVSGTVLNNENIAVPFASVGIMQNDIYAGGSVSDEHGRFRLGYAFKHGTTYQLKVSSVGYQPSLINFIYPDTSSFKSIKLKEEPNMLAAVHVTGQRPLMERKADRYVVNVEGSFLANGNSGLEVLQKSPGIWVSAEGSIKIKGNQSVMVMINDVVQRMSEADLAEYLRTLRSEDISKIEIISNPPSEFEAAGSGGIIHIILKRTRQDGLVGSVSSQYRQQVHRPAYNGSISLNYKLKDLYLSGNVSAGKEESDYIASTTTLYPDQSRYASNTDRYNNNDRILYRIGAVYELTKNQSLSLQTIQTVNRLNQYFDTYINFTESSRPLTGSARSEWFRKPLQSSTTINYGLKLDSLGSAIKFIGDYLYSTKTELNNFASSYTVPEQNSTYRNNTPNFTNLYSLQSDLTSVLRKKWEFKAGLKFVATERDNEVLNEDYIDGNWVRNTRLSNRFVYTEYLSMAYTSLAKSIGKLIVKAGLRAEETRMKGNSITGNETFTRKYLSLFPSLFIMQHLNQAKGSSVFLNYSRRLQRPSFADLNPYRLQFDDYLTQLGNPNLMPEYTHKIEVGTSLGNGISVDVYYTVTTDKIAQLASPVSNNVIEYQTRNFNNSKGYGLSFDAPFKINSWWSTNNSIALYSQSYTISDFNIKQTTLYAGSQHTAAIKGVANIDAGVDYRSPFVNANTHVSYQLYTNFGVSKRVMDKHLLLRFMISDVLNTAREKDYTDYQGTRIDFYQKRPTRTFGLYMSYSFSSGKKFNDKRIEQSNDEERSRIGN